MVRLREIVADHGLVLGILNALLTRSKLDKRQLEPALLRAENRVRADARFTAEGKLDADHGNDWRMLAIAVEELAETEIAPAALADVEVLSFDGGTIDVWLESRFARRLGLRKGALDTGGESDLYVVRSLLGLEALPNLKTLSLDAYGYCDRSRSLEPLADHPALQYLALYGSFTNDDALLSCARLRFVSCWPETLLSEATRVALHERGVVLAPSWRWDGDTLAEPIEASPPPSVSPLIAPTPSSPPRVMVAYRVHDLCPALSRELPPDAAVRACLFFIGSAEGSTDGLFAALPEPSIAGVDQGVAFALRVKDLLAALPSFDSILGGPRCICGFHAGSAAEVEAFLRAEGVTLLPIAPFLAQLVVLDVRTAVGMPVAEASLRRLMPTGEVAVSALASLGDGRFVLVRDPDHEPFATLVTPSATTVLPPLTEFYTPIRESFAF